MTDEEEPDEIELEHRPRIGDYIHVKVPGKVTPKNFVAVITMAETEENLYLSYLARVSGNTLKSGENEDEAWVDTKYILKKLPQPTIGNRELMKFEVDIECDG